MMGFRKLAFAFSLLCFLSFFYSTVYAERNPYDWAFINLDYVRREKVDQLKRFTDKLHQKAQMAAEDKNVIGFFEMNRTYYQASYHEEVPASLTSDIKKLRTHFNAYYIQNYITFYDLLFINQDGVIFYSLRKESNFQAKLIDGGNRSTPLGAYISSKPHQKTFIDFHEYGPSAEPAAFFVEPVLIDGRQVGWIACQLAINKLNSIFASTGDLGQTGETFLVNENGLMLTESYFRGYSTILKEHLDDRNINTKFDLGQGQLAVTDYRGAGALSSFEVIEFMGTSWLVVAKMDKDEIITNHYLQHKRYFDDHIREQLSQVVPPPSQQDDESSHSKTLRVDIDEFMKAEKGDLLETWGVSTCTALLVAFPKRFAYLAHISSKDKVYSGQETNLVG